MERKPIVAWEMPRLEEEASERHERGHSDLFHMAWEKHSRPWLSPVENLSTVHDIAIFYLEGEIGIPECHYLQELIEILCEKGFTKFVFSFAAVEHANYKVFQELMRVAKNLRGHSGDLRFTQISPYLFHIFLFAGADQTIEHFAHVEEGILSFHNTHGRHWH